MPKEPRSSFAPGWSAEAHVLPVVVVLLHEQGLGNGFVAVEHELIERRCEPLVCSYRSSSFAREI
jgi:hypothetical protein